MIWHDLGGSCAIYMDATQGACGAQRTASGDCPSLPPG